ncbi:MAG: DUF5012 domain-containing protein [Bacteroidales bacterium]|nr:DUF5012 domain-containing protein [Bacteroidales bacterium]
MKKLFIIPLAAMLLTACSKDSENVSFITNYAVFDLAGDEVVHVNIGDDYVEPGVKATENGEDVSSKIKVSSDFVKDEFGLFSVSYSIINSDGYLASARREIVVEDPDVEGPQGYFFIHNSRDDVAEAYDLSICFYCTGEPGEYFVSDLIGGFYDQGRAYGSLYRIPGTITIADDGTISLVESKICEGFGGKADAVKGSFNFDTKEFHISTSYHGMVFNMDYQL